MSRVSSPLATSQTTPPTTSRSFGRFSEDILHHLLELHAVHGPIAAIEDGRQRIVFSFDPEFNKQVLSDTATFEARFFAVRGPKSSSQRRVTCGLLAMNGEQHRRNRRMLKEPFSLRSIATYRDTVEQLIDQQMADWRVGQTMDLNDEMTRFMLSVTSTILFGLDAFDEAYALGELIAEWVSLNHEIGIGALIGYTKFNDRYEELLAKAEQLEASVLRMIEQRRQHSTAGSDILSILLNNYGGSGGLTDEELVGQACVLFAAAHMTTAHSLTWTLLLLAQHPEVCRRLWASDTVADGGWSQPTSGELPLIDRVIKESMRVLPASAYSQRITACSVQLGPFDLPRGTPIVFTPLVTHRLNSLCEDPQRFDPDRWLQLKPGPYEYIPFGGGSRMCIGGPLALEIIRTAIPRFLREFGFELEAGATINAEVRSTMLQPEGGVPVVLRTAGEAFASVEVQGNIRELVDFPPPERLHIAPRVPR